MSADDEREQRILDAARDLIVRFGYDKTTVLEIADGAGISKGTVYLHFDSKQELFETLLTRETIRASEALVDYLQTDANAGTVGSVFRGMLEAQHSSELMKAIYRQDAKILGSYLHAADNIFETAYNRSVHRMFIEGMQEAGAIRRELDADVLAHVFDIIDYGFISIAEVKKTEDIPAHEATIEMVAEILERALTPADGEIDREASNAVIRELIESYEEVLGDG